MKIEFELSPELSEELQTALNECTANDEFKIDGNQFALQALECLLADRRMERIAEAANQ